MNEQRPALQPTGATAPDPVLLFDGECGLCHRVVRLLLRLDGGERLRFTPLQGVAGQAYLRVHGLPVAEFDSLVFVPDWAHHGQSEFLLRTDGVLAAFRTCGGLGAEMAAVLAIFPSAWRDSGYRIVARWRYRIFGMWRPRPLARADWVARFLP